MSNETEDALVKENQQIIRDYLIGQFKGFELTDTPNRPLSHMFGSLRPSQGLGGFVRVIGNPLGQ